MSINLKSDFGQLLLVAGFVLLSWSFCIHSTIESNSQLSDSKKITGLLRSIDIRKSTGRSNSYFVFFQIDKISRKLDLIMANRDDTNELASQFQIGDKIILYYSATEWGPELRVSQVQTNDKIIYSLADAHREAWHRALFSGVIALFLTMVGAMLTYKKIRKSQLSS